MTRRKGERCYLDGRPCLCEQACALEVNPRESRSVEVSRLLWAAHLLGSEALLPRKVGGFEKAAVVLVGGGP